MPLPLTVSCSSKKSRLVLPFWYRRAYPGCPGKEAVKWLLSMCTVQAATRTGVRRATGARWRVAWTSTTADRTGSRAGVSSCSASRCGPSCEPCTASAYVYQCSASEPRRLYILCWSELSRRRLLPAVSPAAGRLTTPTVAGLPGLCENFRSKTSKSSPILRLLSSHWATSVVRTRVVGVANFGDSLRRLCSLQHRIYNLIGRNYVGN